MTQQYIVESYVFDKTAKTISMPSIPELKLEGIQLITNLTTGTLIYQFNNAALGGTVSGNTLTLTYDTSAMANTDKLQILYNPPSGGFFDRALSLLYQAVEYLRAPQWTHQVASNTGPAIYMRVQSDTNSNLNNVASVTTVSTVTAVSNLTNYNTIDSRELVWSLWDTEYNTGIRNKIV